MKELESKKFIFQENREGQLQFIGDFDGLYASDSDPWSQSANGIKGYDYRKYYNFSRTRLGKEIKNIESKKDLLEVGCGTGFVLKFLADSLPSLSLNGIDISPIAIQRARVNFPEYNFSVGDIQSPELVAEQYYDIVIFSHVLWYILENLNTAVLNAHKLLRSGGHLIINQAFFKEEQHYGNEILDGFSGCQQFMELHHNSLFSLISSNLDKSSDLKFNDGILIYKRRIL
jgi:SAM-dependent methyltransferase